MRSLWIFSPFFPVFYVDPNFSNAALCVLAKKVSRSEVAWAAWNSFEADFLILALIGLSNSGFLGDGEVVTSSHFLTFFGKGDRRMFLETCRLNIVLILGSLLVL